MKKILQGRYALTCTKEEATQRFQEMEGYCREHISDDNPIRFSCSKKGRIVICDPPRGRSSFNDACTKLYGEIVAQEGEVYVTYYTTFDKVDSVIKMIFNLFYVIMSLLAIALAITKAESFITLLVCIGCLVISVRRLYVGSHEKGYSYQDSEILIQVLEERVKAVNRWDEE